jgi:hypothetical protein
MRAARCMEWADYAELAARYTRAISMMTNSISMGDRLIIIQITPAGGIWEIN